MARRRPYSDAESPSDGATSVGVSANITFDIITDDLSAASIDTSTFDLTLNGTTIIQAGINLLPGQYTVTLTPALRALNVLIDPVSTLAADTVFVVESTFADDTGTAGHSSFAFSTGTVAFAMQLERSEPLLCPIDTLPVPLFTTRPDVVVTKYSDTISSVSTDFTATDIIAYDSVEIASGPDAGRYLVRSSLLTTAQLYFTAAASSTGLIASAYKKQDFADRNPVKLIFSPLFIYKHQKIWGDTQTRYFAGYPSDGNFPVGFAKPPEASIHDSIDFPSFSPGGFFEDQTNERLDFELICNPPTTATVYDKYSVPFEAKILPELTGSVTLTNGSQTVAGTNFDTELHEGAILTFGSDTTLYTVQSIDSAIQITLSDAWTGVNGVYTAFRKIAGTRSLTAFRITEMLPNTEFFIGLVGQSASPTLDADDRLGVSFIVQTDNTIAMKGFIGSTEGVQLTGMTVPQFTGQDWVLEIELIDEQVMTANLLSLDDLATVESSRSVTVSGSSAPDLDRWTLTTLSAGASFGNQGVKGYVRHIDVEPGQARPFSLDGGFVGSANSKARVPQNITNVAIGSESGWRSLNTTGAIESSFAGSQFDQIFWDIDETFAIIDSFSIEGGASTIVDRGLPSQRTVKKFSLMDGFDELTLTFRANKRGYWYAIVDGTDPSTDLVVARGLYDVVNNQQVVQLDADLLGGIADGLHSINIVVCKEPAPFSAAFLLGVCDLTGRANVIVQSDATLTGVCDLTCSADVILNSEVFVIENLSAQVDGVASTFTASMGYQAGKIMVFLDGVAENYNPTDGRVTETSPAGGTFTLDSIPRAGQRLVVQYIPTP